MAYRNRSRSTGGVGGSASWNNGITERTISTSWENCIDDTGPGDGKSLTIRKCNVYGGYASGEFIIADKLGELNSFPLQYATDVTAAQQAFVTGRPSNATLASQLLARTNPSRAIVDIPVFIGELADLPDLVRKFGGGLLRRLADGNIRYQFGIRPLVADLTAMLNFVDHTDQRMRELQALQRSGLRRKRDLWQGTSSKASSGTISLNSSPYWLGVQGTWTATSMARCWGFVKWIPSGDFPTTDRELLRLARRAVLGLTIDGSTAWELIPFSWLIDWFSNVGDLLKARRNIVPCSPSPVQIMVMTRTETRYTISSDSTKLYKDFTAVETRKERLVASASLSAQMSLLSLRQMSILGSLAILRSGRY